LNQEGLDLTGKRILVVEDDYLLAKDVCAQLRDLGATVLGPAPTPFYANQLIGPPGKLRVHAAVLDVHLHGTTVFEFADELLERSVPILFATAYQRKAIPPRFNNVPLLEKPLDRDKLVGCVVKLVRTEPIETKAPTKTSNHESRPPMPDELPVHHFARAILRHWRSY
jgi:two-component SAPR family response regulator